MLAYDLTYSTFKRSLAADANSITTGADLLGLALAALVATTGNATTKAALGAAATGVLGAKGVINTNLYFQRTLPALLAQMDANRARAKRVIILGLRQPDAEYPLQQALIDLDTLRDSGGIPGAISGITQSAEEAKMRALEFQRGAAFVATRLDRQAIINRIETLTPQQRTALLRIMAPRIEERSSELRALLGALKVDPVRTTDPKKTLVFLEQWAGNEDPAPGNLEQWSVAIDEVQASTAGVSAQSQRMPSRPVSPTRRGGATPSRAAATGPVVASLNQEAIRRRIEALKDPQVIRLANLMVSSHLASRPADEQKNLSTLGLDQARQTQPQGARIYVEQWLGFEGQNPAFLKEWDDALHQVSTE
jgi:hypothetical protein